MSILITGGTGFIGSHTCVALLEKGYSIVVVDNLINSDISVVKKIKEITGKHFEFYELDVCDEDKMNNIFLENDIKGVVHFAGFKAVGESVLDPIKYYKNNLNSTLTLASLCVKHGIGKFVFSSSATVYGDNKSPFKEEMSLLPSTNPYGETKAICERILTDINKAHPSFKVALLRYFNPIGAHESGLIGENPKGVPNNLMPYLTKVAKKELPELNIFGDDYNTLDGTGVRDYIHVMDLAEGHVRALEKNEKSVGVYNLGTGKGTSVLQLIKAFESSTGEKIPYNIVARRPGDIAVCYADASKANRELNWKTKRTIEDMCRDAWLFKQNNMNQY